MSRVPRIRFKGFEEDWEQSKLSEIYKNICNAYVGTATPYYVEDGHFYLEANNVKDGKINYNSQIFINDNFYESQKDKWLNSGDIVMVQSGHVGHAAVIPEELENTVAHALILFKNAKVKIEPYFLNYQYQTLNFKRKIENITVGNTIKHILASDMKEHMVYVSRFAEQIIVSKYFQTLDHLITLHQRKLEKLKTIKKSMLENLFPQNGEKTPKIRFSGFIEDWEQRKLGEIGMIITGSTPSTSLKYYYTDDSDEGIVWVTPTDIINNITVESEKRLTSLGQKVAHIVPQNTILVTCIASIGKNTMLIDRGSFNQQINGLIPYENKYEPYFLLTESFIWSNKMKSSAPAGTMQIVNRKEFSEIDAGIPNKSEQNSVGSFFRTLDHLITLHQLEPYNLVFKAIAYRIIDYAKSKPPRCIKNAFISNIITLIA